MHNQRSNISQKKSLKEKKEQKIYNRLGFLNDYSSKKFGTIIETNPGFRQNINLLISPHYKQIFNPNSILKGEKSNLSKKNLNDLSNSNALMKSTEENLISAVNGEIVVSRNSKSNGSKRNSIKKSETSKNKLDGAGILKNALNIFNTKSLNEGEKIKNKSSTKILSNKIFEEIEKEKNKILTHQKKRRNSAIFKGNSNNYLNINIKPKETKKKRKNRPSLISSEKYTSSFTNTNSNINNNKVKVPKKRRFSIFTGRESMQIKSLRDLGLHISNTLSKVNVKGIKKEIKDFETSEISKIIEKYPTQNRPMLKERQSLERTNIVNDLSRISRYSKDNNVNNKYEERFRKLFTCNNLYDSLDDDENEDPEKSNIYYIAPNSIACIIIDSFIFVASILSLIYIPIFLASIFTNCKVKFFSGINFIYIFIELVYLLDLVTGFFKAYYNFEEVLIVKKRFMMINYLRGSFIIDLIEAIPFFIILNSGQENCDREDCFNYAFTDNIRYSLLILQILKVLKLYKNSALKMIDKFLSKNNFYSYFIYKFFLYSLFSTFSKLLFYFYWEKCLSKLDCKSWTFIKNIW